MAAVKTLKASVLFGGAVSGSFKAAISTTKGSLQVVGKTIADIDRRQRLLGTSIRTFGSMGKNVDRMREEYAGLARESERLRAAQSRLLSVQSRVNANLDRRAHLRGKLFGAVAAAGAFALPVAEAVKFESTMADVRKVVNFDTPMQFRQMGKDVLKLSTQLPMAADGIGQIVAAAGQAGIARGELIDFAKSAVKMGVAFDLTAEQSGQMMATWRTGLKLTQAQVVTLADKINFLGNKGGANAAQISSIVTKVGPFARTAGLAAGQVAAIGSAMVSMGAQEDVASTALKRMAINLTQGRSATAKQKQAFKELGMSSAQVAEDMQRDASGTIVRVFAEVQKLPKAMQGAALTNLFGSESVQAIAPLLTNLDLLRKRFDAVGDASLFAGSMDKEYATRAATTANTLRILKGQATAAAVTFGKVLLPAVNSVAKTFGKSISSISAFAEEHPKLTKYVVGGAAALVGFRVAALGVGYAFTFVASPVLKTLGFIARWRAVGAVAAMGKFGKAIQVVGRTIGWLGRFVMANPVVLIGAAVVGVAYEIYKHWNGVKAFFGRLWQDVGSIFSGGLKIIKGLFTLDFGLMADGVKQVFNGLKTFFKDFFSGIAKGLATMLDDALKALGLLDEKERERKVGKEQAAREKAARHKVFGAAALALVPGFGPANLGRQLDAAAETRSQNWSWNTGDANDIAPPAPKAAPKTTNNTFNYQITSNTGESADDFARRLTEHQRRHAAISERGGLADGNN